MITTTSALALPNADALATVSDVTPIGCSASVAVTLSHAGERIVCKLQPEKFILVDSYAYGRLTPGSDADLLVIVMIVLASE